MTTKITEIPHEIILYILESETLSIEDVSRFCRTNSSFSPYIRDNLLWMKKYYQKSITANAKHSSSKKKELARAVNFSSILIPVIKNMKIFEMFISRSGKLTSAEELNLVTRIKIASDTALSYYYIRDEFDRIFLKARKTFNCGKVYLIRLMRYYLTLNKFIRDQNRILALRKNYVSFERQTVIILQSLRPSISLSKVKLWITNLTERLLKRLKNIYTIRLFFFENIETFRYWLENWEKDDFWSVKRLEEIMRHIEIFSFEEINWRSCPLMLDETASLKSERIPNYIHIYFKKILPVLTHYFIAYKLGISCRLNFKHERIDSIGIEWTLR